jgi:hypothetical protein
VTARDRTVFSVLAIVGLIAGFWFVLLNPRRDEAKKLADQVTAAQQRLDTARQTVASAEQAKAAYDHDYATVARLGKAVPVDDDVPSLVYQLEHASDRASVDFRSIKLAASSSSTASTPQTNASAAAAVGQAEKNPSGNAATDGSASPSSPSGTAASAANPAATQTSAAGLPPGASVGPAGFPTMPFDFAFTGSFFRLEGFLKALDRFTVVNGDRIKVRGRLLTVDGISLSAAASGFPRMSAQIHATAYLLPSTQGLTNGATPTTPGDATAQATDPNSSTASPATTAAITGGVR